MTAQDTPSLATSAMQATNSLAAKILAELREKIKELPPCDKTHVRLWRAGVVDSEKYKQMYGDAHTKVYGGLFAIDSAKNKLLADRLISKRDKLVDRFYSDSLSTALPYFLKYHDDMDAERILYYIDVPIDTAKKNFFANVATNMLGAVHHENIFSAIIKDAQMRAKLVEESLKHDPIVGAYDQSSDDTPIDLDAPNNRAIKIQHLLETAAKMEGRSKYFSDLVKAFQTCQFDAIEQEFYLPHNLVQKARKKISVVDGSSACKLSDEQWKEIGTALDCEFNPGLLETRSSLKYKSQDEAVRETFGVSSHTALHMI